MGLVEADAIRYLVGRNDCNCDHQPNPPMGAKVCLLSEPSRIELLTNLPRSILSWRFVASQRCMRLRALR